jgi:hypothetical protein
MAYFNIHHYSRLCFISFLSASFTFVSITTPSLHAFEFNLDDAIWLTRVEKLVNNFKKLGKSNSKHKIYKGFYELRKDLENELNVKFDTKQALKVLKKSLERNAEFDEKQIDAAAHEIQSCSKKGEYKEDAKLKVKGGLAFGITLSLAGLFLYCTKIPAVQYYADWMIKAGGGIILKSMCEKLDESSEKKR